MLFLSFYRTLVGKTVRNARSSAPLTRACQITVELKNDLAITGTLHSVDQARRLRGGCCRPPPHAARST